MSTVFAIFFGAIVGLQLSRIFKAIKDHIDPKQRDLMMTIAHLSTAISVLAAVFLHLREISLRIAVLLSDYLGVLIVKYAGPVLLPLAGYLGSLAKVLFDYAALAHPVNPVIQALALYVCAQMLVFEFLMREKK